MKDLPDPFITGTPILQPCHFFGRQKELKRLFNLLSSHPLQNAAIIGQKRSGKTSLLNYLRSICTASPAQLRPGQKTDWLPNPHRYRWIFVDFQDPRMAHHVNVVMIGKQKDCNNLSHFAICYKSRAIYIETYCQK